MGQLISNKNKVPKEKQSNLSYINIKPINYK